MILSDSEIEANITRKWGKIVIRPFNRENLGPNSYDLTLAPTLLVYQNKILDSRADNPTRRIDIPEDGLVLKPGELYLGSTVEYTETHNLVPMLEGRSSFGRLGLLVHVTAGFGDSGFCGTWTLELYALRPIRVYAGQRIAQIYYHELSGQVLQDYRAKGGKYMDQGIPVASRSYLDKEVK